METSNASAPTDTEVDRLRRAIRAPTSWLDDEAHERATHIVRRDVLKSIDEALVAASKKALLVKGAGLAETVYPHPWQRPMADVDILVNPDDAAGVLTALEAAGFQAETVQADRRLSAALLGERGLTLQRGTINWLIEIHHQIDKIVPRPIAFEDVLARSSCVSDFGTLRAPCREDHALLVILHASSSEFLHTVAWIDLALLMRKDFNWTEFETRARDWRLQTATYTSLKTLEALGFEGVPAGLVRRLEPGWTRTRLLNSHYAVGQYPVSRGPMRLGWTWMRRQFPLRDDTGRWLTGIARYAGLRTWEKIFRPRR